jgi:integrase
MSFHVKKKKRPDGTVTWKLQESTWTDGKVKYSHVPMSQLLQYGLPPSLSVEDAIARVRQLNAASRLDREGEKRKSRALRSQRAGELLSCAHLPARYLKEFEDDYLRRETSIGTNGPEKYKKARFTWNYCKALIKHIDLPQQHWHQHRRRFYSKLAEDLKAPSYVGKILTLLNMWGAFIAIKTETSFVPVPSPKGHDREMIADAYVESAKKKKVSDPLTPAMLEGARSRFKDEQWRWLYLSVWLGLRPPEVDAVASSRLTREQDVPVLWIYQTKLRGVKKENRYKPIPLIYPEQLKCLDFMKQTLERPVVKTLQKYLGSGLNLYGGRKGFTDLMLERGQSLENVSTWLGHSTIERTWASYKQKNRVAFKKIS